MNFQILYCYSVHVTDCRFDLLQHTIVAPAWRGGYSWRLKGVGYLSRSVVRWLLVQFLSWSEIVNAITVYRNGLKSLNQTKWHANQKLQSQFFLHVLKLAETYAWKAYSGRFHWIRGYDKEPEAKDDSFDSFVQRKIFAVAFEILQKFEANYTFGKLEVLQLKWNKWNRTWHPNPKMMSSIPSLSATFFCPHSFQIGLATSRLFLGTIPCLQVKHWYMNDIVVPGIDQQYWNTDSSAWYSGYGWRLVGVGLRSFSPFPCLCCSFAVGSRHFLVGPCKWCECMLYLLNLTN